MYERKCLSLIIISKFVTSMKQRRVLLGIGSNVDSTENIMRVKTILSVVLSDIRCTDGIWSKAIGIHAPDFQNCLVLGTTEMSLEELNCMLKKVERDCGRTGESKASGRISMDIDVLSYGGKKFHEDDWDRPYVQQLLRKLRMESSDVND
uniref:2-amino-4-hydroxy-6-hydroxymethyldihydropteridine diphosphokinase n=1 Tax=Prevotella sp. GTC17260 TaxID=3236796 RepID=A0AB33JEU7_9BACT